MFKILKLTLILAALYCFCPVHAQNGIGTISREEYIRMYKPLVMVKMRDFGIPASVAMAQAIIESNSGNSELAKNANNHFGIKCHDWTGPVFRWDDDEKNECFRKYVSAEESFYDHSLFLTYRPRYAALFELDITDYKAWAHGLRRSGYATNPHYPQLLIKMIEENRLYEIDEEVLHGPVLAGADDKPDEIQPLHAVSFSEFGPGPGHRTLYLMNRRLFIFADADDTYFKIANDFNIQMSKLFHINDAEPGTQVRQGSPVFIEAKRRRSKIPVHEVKIRESMHDIAQNYGIRLKSLYRMNNMLPGDQPVAGQQIKLR